MTYSSLEAVRQRAGELARSGHFETCEEIVEALRWERYQKPERAVRSGVQRDWLRTLIMSARGRKRFDA